MIAPLASFAIIAGLAATILVGNPLPLVLLWAGAALGCALTAAR